MTTMQGLQPSVNARAGKLVEDLVASAAALRCAVTIGEAGERRIDLGAGIHGGLEAGRRLGEICMGGLGTVSITSASGLERWPLGVVVHSTNPVIACLASQYAGWTIQEQESGFFALGSGPARALSRVEELYKELGYVDHHNKAALVIEGDKAPPSSVARKVATACGVQPSDLTILYAPTGSLAGTVQIAARVLEVALHKAHALHFPLEHIVDGYGVAPDRSADPGFRQGHGTHQRRHHLRRPHPALRARPRRRGQEARRPAARRAPARSTASPSPRSLPPSRATSTRSTPCSSARRR